MAAGATTVIPGEQTAATVATPRPTMTNYPPGASPEAHYYEDSNSRTGWYALAAFIALIALVAGGVLLFQSLNKEQPNTAAVVLPTLTDMSLDEATAILNDLDLPFQSFAEENQLVPEEFVHRTDPTAGTVVPEGTTIKLYYRPSLELKNVPIVVGLPIEEARNILGTEGFQIEQIEEESDIESGIVIRTDPPGDTPVKQDTIITVVVSSGPNQVAIPSIIINDPVEEARALLESTEYGLVVVVEDVVDDLVEVGLVVRTNPEPGSLVNRGSTVTLFVSSGPGQVTMPPLVGNPEGQATNLLRELGLREQVEYRDLQPGDPNDGLVIQQSVNPGVNVDKGTNVRLIVGRATAPATTTSTTTTTTTTTTTVPPTTTTTVPASTSTVA